MAARLRGPLLIVTVFWVYVAVCDVLYADSMQRALEAIHVVQLFAPWQPRLLQHLLLYPVLLGCVAGSYRLGWNPFARRAPLQLLLGVLFSALAIPCLLVGDLLAGDFRSAPHVSVYTWSQASAVAAPIWLASVMRFLITYAFAVGLVSGFELYRTLRDEENHSAALAQELTTARLASLRMQLSPHSLLNLLQSIHGQIEWDPTAAQALVVRFGDLLRRLLSASEREYWRLAEEIHFAQLYLELQQRRFAERLRFELPELAALPAAWVPSLVLQPLVENAVVHGLAGHHGVVSVRVEVRPSGQHLTLRVTNSMAHMEPRGPGGIGLKNVRDRLGILFGERATVCAAPGRAREWITEVKLPLLVDVRVPINR
jgi:hypothetical protein